MELPRCLFPNQDKIIRKELHTFCDASEEAYAAVVYIRSIYQDGSTVVRHIKGATKLSPLKTLSVPRLELNAALLGARLPRFVEGAITCKLQGRRFWTDSSTVRNWIRAAAADYQPFVSHRIGEIQTITEAQEWRFVPGKLNPADAATRSQLQDQAIPQRWLDGPEFLLQEETDWPSDLPWISIKDEKRTAIAHIVTSDGPVTSGVRDGRSWRSHQTTYRPWFSYAARSCNSSASAKTTNTARTSREFGQGET